MLLHFDRLRNCAAAHLCTTNVRFTLNARQPDAATEEVRNDRCGVGRRCRCKSFQARHGGASYSSRADWLPGWISTIQAHHGGTACARGHFRFTEYYRKGTLISHRIAARGRFLRADISGELAHISELWLCQTFAIMLVLIGHACSFTLG
jgi:hypothetical protein